MAKMIANKKNFYLSLTNDEQADGLAKANIQRPEAMDGLEGKGVWVWFGPDEKKRVEDEEFRGTVWGIIVSKLDIGEPDVRQYDKILFRCRGSERPTVDPEWYLENIMGTVERAYDTEGAMVAFDIGEYSLCVDLRNYDDLHPELTVFLCDRNGIAHQDICVVRKAERSQKIECLVWGDENEEDYTSKFGIGIYEEQKD